MSLLIQDLSLSRATIDDRICTFACLYAAYAIGMYIDCPPGCVTRDFAVVNHVTCALFEWP